MEYKLDKNDSELKSLTPEFHLSPVVLILLVEDNSATLSCQLLLVHCVFVVVLVLSKSIYSNLFQSE